VHVIAVSRAQCFVPVCLCLFCALCCKQGSLLHWISTEMICGQVLVCSAGRRVLSGSVHLLRRWVRVPGVLQYCSSTIVKYHW